MKETPMLFSTPMVQAILEGRKTQTRRVIKPQPECINQITPIPVEEYVAEIKKLFKKGLKHLVDGTGGTVFPDCLFGKPGDLLWVRETYQKIEGNRIIYKANPLIWGGKWKPSIHMPKAAARIWLQVVSIRPERLQNITKEDAIAEGIAPLAMSSMQLAQSGQLYFDYSKPKQFFNEGLPPFWSFNSLWCSINGRDSWEANPWVWRIEFKVLSTTGKPSNIERIC
jgi:hypothetical protein